MKTAYIITAYMKTVLGIAADMETADTKTAYTKPEYIKTD